MNNSTPIKPLKDKFEFTITYEDLENDNTLIESELAKALQEEIDREVVNSIKAMQYKDWGWFKVETGHIDIDENWMPENIKHRWGMVERSFYFESKDEAVMFTLRWVGNGTESD